MAACRPSVEEAAVEKLVAEEVARMRAEHEKAGHGDASWDPSYLILAAVALVMWLYRRQTSAVRSKAGPMDSTQQMDEVAGDWRALRPSIVSTV